MSLFIRKHKISTILVGVFGIFLPMMLGAAASALDIKQENLVVDSQSSTITIHDAGIGEFRIAPNIEFNKLNDYITYKLTLKNLDGKNYKVVSVKDTNSNSQIKTVYNYPSEMNPEDKDILVSLVYSELDTNKTPLKSFTATISLIDDENNTEDITIEGDVTAPDTGRNLGTTNAKPNTVLSIMAFIFGVIAFYTIFCSFINRNRKIKEKVKIKNTVGVILAFLLIPGAIAIAANSKDITFEINFNQASINGPYKVTFNTDGGTAIAPQIIEKGDKASRPANPTKNGYMFQKWVDEEGNDFDFDTPITTDRNIKAIYNIETYSITYTLDGGTATNPTSYTIETNTFTLNNPEKAGYNFIGWTGSSGTTPEMTVTITKGTTGDLSYTANFEKATYTITYNYDNATNVPNNPGSYDIDTETFTLVNPSKTSYEFIGWTGSNGTTPEMMVTITKGTTGDKVYTANFVRLYSMTFDADGGTVDPSVVYRRVGSEIGVLPVPEKEGYDFVEWQVGGVKLEPTYIMSSNKRAVAIYTPKTYEVTFDDMWETQWPRVLMLPYGTNLSDYMFDRTCAETVTYNDFSIRDCSYHNYRNNGGVEFVGWYELDFDTYEYTSIDPMNAVVAHDMYLRAFYTPITYQIDYDLDGGTVGFNPTVYTVETDTFTLNNPTKDGYVFIGWTGSNGATSQTTVTITKGTVGNLSYKANWKKIHTITLDAGSGSVTPTSFTCVDGEALGNLPTPTPPAHYNFAGWWNGAMFVSSSYKPTTDMTLVAQYTSAGFSITYNLDGGTVGFNPTVYTVETNTFTLNNPTRDGYVFAGWTGSNGTTPEMTVTITKGTTGDLSYTASWKKIHTITLDAGAGSVTPTSFTRVDGEALGELPTPTPPAHYTFHGWYITNSAIARPEMIISGDLRVVAMYAAVKYQISYDLDGGTVATANRTSYDITTNDFTLNNPTKDGWQFIGWTGSNGTTPQTTVTIAKGTTGNLSYTANWKKIHTITLDAGAGSVTPTSFTRVDGEALGELPTPTSPANHVFSGWRINSVTFATPTYIPTSDMTLTAQYTITNYTITYNLDGGTVSPANPTSYNTNTNTFTLNNPTKEGYIFIGWTGSNGTTPEMTITITKGTTGNKTYTANWQDAELYNAVENSTTKTTYNGSDKGTIDTLSTLSSPKNIYFETSNEHNNVLFDGKCWQIIRTTETGGTKMMYNGEAVNGTCTSNGLGVTSGAFNSNSDSLAYAGYQYNTVYENKAERNDDPTAAIQLNFVTSDVNTQAIITNMYYTVIEDKFGEIVSSSSYMYDTATMTYRLSGNYEGPIVADTRVHEGRYTCGNGELSCSTLYYIAGYRDFYGINGYVATLAMRGGESLANVDYDILSFGKGYTENSDGTYNLTNVTTYKASRLIMDFATIAENAYYDNYVCLEHSGSWSYVEDKYTVGKNTNCATVAGDAYLFRGKDFNQYIMFMMDGVTEDIYYGEEVEYDLRNDSYSFSDLILPERLYRYGAYGKYEKRYTFNNRKLVAENNVKFIYNDKAGSYGDAYRYYIELTGGDIHSTAKNDMLFANNVNSIRSLANVAVDDFARTLNLSRLENIYMCNDRSIKRQGGWADQISSTSQTNLAFTASTSSLSCGNLDKFSNANNSAKLGAPVALPSLAEVSGMGAAGTVSEYWTATPDQLDGIDMKIKTSTGSAKASEVKLIRPVISLRAGTRYTSGNGSTSSPYVIAD